MARIILIGLLAIIGLPLVLSLAMMAMGSTVAAVFLMNMWSLMGWDSPPSRKEWNVVNVGRQRNNQDAYRAITEPDKFTDRRVILVMTYIGADDIKGAARPTNAADLDNFVRVNAPQLAAQECARVIQALAAKCAVTQSDVSQTDGGLYRLGLVLSYTVKDAFGNVPETVPLDFIEVHQNLVEGAPNRLITRGQQEEARLGMYRKAAALCASTRSAKGNCAINQIKIETRREKQSASTMRISGVATLGMLQRQARAP